MCSKISWRGCLAWLGLGVAVEKLAWVLVWVEPRGEVGVHLVHPTIRNKRLFNDPSKVLPPFNAVVHLHHTHTIHLQQGKDTPVTPFLPLPKQPTHNSRHSRGCSAHKLQEGYRVDRLWVVCLEERIVLSMSCTSFCCTCSS